MTKFQFTVNNVYSASSVLRKIERNFNKNEQVKNIVYRNIKKIKNIFDHRVLPTHAIYECEIIIPFPDLRIYAWYLTFITIIISIFYMRWYIFIPNILLLITAYGTKYMQSPSFNFLMLKKGMYSNGYKGIIKRY